MRVLPLVFVLALGGGSAASSREIVFVGRYEGRQLNVLAIKANGSGLRCRLETRPGSCNTLQEQLYLESMSSADMRQIGGRGFNPGGAAPRENAPTGSGGRLGDGEVPAR